MSEIPQSEILNLTKKPVPTWTKMIDLTLISISGRIDLPIGQKTPTTLTFSSAEIGNGTVKSASTNNIVGSLGKAIIDGIALRLNEWSILGTETFLTGLVRVVILLLAPTLDMIINALLGVLGIKLGEADVRVIGVRCSAPTLIR